MDTNILARRPARGRLAVMLGGLAAAGAIGTAVGPAGSQAALPPAGYTLEQAVRGELIFETTCSGCHGAGAVGALGPSWRDAEFREHWFGKPVAEVFGFIQSQMPQGAPGTLTTMQYVDVIAYMLRINGVMPGMTELPYTLDGLTGVALLAPPLSD
jgi:mono/diheme cytochrome c family protein